MYYLCTRNTIKGALAQLVEHRTENPCVPGSIPGGTTYNNKSLCLKGSYCCIYLHTIKHMISELYATDKRQGIRR